jgi:hypothetical protein
MDKPYYEKTSADKQQLGFLYQDLVCLKYLLNLQQGEEVGCEVFDDVHHQAINGNQQLVQVKHSSTEGETLTNKDEDLWKTLYNWIRALEDVPSKNVSFTFYANKQPTNKPGILALLLRDEYSADEIEQVLQTMFAEAKRKNADKKTPMGTNFYIEYFCSQTKELQHNVLRKITFVFDGQEIIKELRRKIETFGVPENNSEELLDKTIGIYTKKKYEIVKSKKKFVVSYEQFRKEFQFDRNLQLVRSRKQRFDRYYEFTKPKDINPQDGLFSRQLRDIKVEQEDIIDYAVEYAATNMYLEQLKREGDYSDSEDKTFEEEVSYEWKDIHADKFDCETKSDDEKKRIARSVLRATTSLRVEVSKDNVVKGLVKGKAIGLSDKAKIGWLDDWKKRYGHQKK